MKGAEELAYHTMCPVFRSLLAPIKKKFFIDH
jgi:hypothetical protein